MILNLGFLLSLLGTVGGGFLLGVTFNLPATDVLLNSVNQVLHLLGMLLPIGGLVWFVSQIMDLGERDTSRLPGQPSSLMILAGILALWSVGFGLGHRGTAPDLRVRLNRSEAQKESL
ncbi:hypothetical protein [Deinococcus sp. Leaf326]|uniref:hypothetical protein n=1 Tax=Deinococcus sp. Leaf326 TaxID=1736338 RepID=UPI0006FB3F60|nr:hypothetical protein [Deinococcus sp. Leaf326]KQR26985.1 hypothetical protein ASF71_18000 [Deinococcus sp. Leaf326]